MRILVTGGKGTIGTSLVKELTRRGMEVWTCDIKHGHEENYLRCDITQYRQLSGIFTNKSFDYVYHLAAEFGRWNGEDYYEQMWLTNAVGTKNLIKLQEKHGFKMIFTSSSEVYGDYHGVMEEAVMDTAEVKQINDYALSKWVNELQILNSKAMYNTETVRIRLFNVYGPGEYYSPYRSAVALFTYRALHNMDYDVYLNHKRTSLYIDDCVSAMADVLNNYKPGEVYNLAGSEPHDMKYVSDMILRTLGKSDTMVTYKDLEPFTTHSKVPSLLKAERDLDFAPRVALENGIPKTVAWMKQVYNCS